MKIVFHQLCFNTRRTSRHFAPTPCIFWIKKWHSGLLQHYHWFSWISSSDEWWTSTPIKNQSNFWKIELYGEYCCTLWEDSSLLLIWYDMIWYDMIWYDMIWYDMIWYDMIWYDMIWYDMIWYDDCFECYKKNILVHVDWLFRCSQTPWNKISQVMMNLEMCIVTKYKLLWHHLVVQSITGNKSGRMPQILQVVSTSNSWSLPTITETLINHWKREGPPNKGIKIVISLTPPNQVKWWWIWKYALFQMPKNDTI
jgi:hypothetical protein